MSELNELRTKQDTLQRLLPHVSAKEQARVRKELSAVRQQIALFMALGFETEPDVAASDKEPNSAA